MSIKNKKIKILKLIKNTLIGSFLLLVGCSNPISSEDEATLSFDMRLPKDGNGYYHLTLELKTFGWSGKVICTGM